MRGKRYFINTTSITKNSWLTINLECPEYVITVKQLANPCVRVCGKMVSGGLETRTLRL
jgi:hypothetical protein